MNLKTRTAGQTMVINARRRLGMKTTPQPVVETAAKAEAKAVSRPTRRMRSKGPLQTADFQKSPHPGGDPPYGHTGGDRLDDQDARGSGGVPNPPGLPVRHNPGGPPGDSGDDGGGGGHDESEEDTPVHSDDGTGHPRKPEDDPNPEGPHGRHSRMYSTMTINKWAKPIPKLDLPPRIHTQKASKIKQIWETWCVQVALALSTWNSLAVPYWSDIYGRAERDYEKWRKSTMTARYKHETRFLYGRKAPIPPNCDAIEALLRLELLTQFPNWLSQKATMLGCTSSHDILRMALKEIFPNEDATRFDLVEELYSLPQKPPSTMHTFAAWLEDWVTKLVAADEISAYVEPRRAMAVLSHVGKPLQAQDTLFMTEWVAIFRESGDTPYFTSVHFWMLRRALQAHRQGQKTFPPTYWKQLYTTAIREGPTLRMAKSTETTKIAKPDMKKCSLPQLGSYMTKTFLSQGLRQMVEQSQTRVSIKPSSTYTPLTSCVLGLDPPHSVVNVDASRQEWLHLLHLLATHRPTHLQHDYTTILIQTGDFTPVQTFPNMWEKATMIMLGKYKSGEIWTEGSGTTPCPSACLSDKYKVTDGHLIPVDNQFLQFS